jgi:bifunctional non-homologous end joining protein LigD
MLARSGRLPTSGDFAYELKWDGSGRSSRPKARCACASHRGWDMTEHVGFLAQLPVRAVLDGELVSLDADGKPDFPQLCECVLLKRAATPLTLFVFDVAAYRGRSLADNPHTGTAGRFSSASTSNFPRDGPLKGRPISGRPISRNAERRRD